MQLAVFNGSPRGRKGNSKIVLDHFLSGFESNPKNSYELYYLNRLKDAKLFVQAFGEAETVLLVHPLYTDAMPAIVKHFIEQLEPLVERETAIQRLASSSNPDLWRQLIRVMWSVAGRSFPGA